MNIKNIENNDSCWTVYSHINKINGKRYIGITSQPPEERWGINGSRYLRKNKRGRYNQPKLAHAIKKYGWDNFDHIILEENLTKSNACEIEKNLIALWDTIENGYNMLSGGEINRFGMKNSEESKRLASEANKHFVGELNPFYGKRHSDETKKRMSKSHIGLHAGENNPNFGKCGADSTRAKSFLQYTKDGDFICEWKCGADAARELNIDLSGIIKCCRGKYHTAGGYIWRYRDDKELFDK